MGAARGAGKAAAGKAAVCHLPQPLPKGYLGRMKAIAPARLYLLSLIGVGALAAIAGLAFAGWMEHAPAILTTLAQDGLAWCF